jgi:hypothetical protein
VSFQFCIGKVGPSVAAELAPATPSREEPGRIDCVCILGLNEDIVFELRTIKER